MALGIVCCKSTNEYYYQGDVIIHACASTDVGKISMEEDVDRTPESGLTRGNEIKGSAIKAILIASAVNITATVFVGVMISVVYGVILATNGESIEVITYKLSNMELTSKVSMLMLVSGLLITAFAGYLCAILVNHSEYKIVTIFAVIIIIFTFSMGLPYYSISENLLMSLLHLCCAYLGAWLHVSKKERLAGG